MTPQVEELVGQSLVALQQKAAKLVAEHVEAMQNTIGLYMQEKGITAHPVMHVWPSFRPGTNDIVCHSRMGYAPEPENREAWFRHLNLNVKLKAKGTVRKRVVDGVEQFYMTKG